MSIMQPLVATSRLGASLLRRAQGRALAPAIRAYKADPQSQHHKEAPKKEKKEQHEGAAALEKAPDNQPAGAAAVARPSSSGQGMMMMSPLHGHSALEAFFPPSAVSMLRQMDQMMAGDPFFSRVFSDSGDDLFSLMSPRRRSPTLRQQQQQQMQAQERQQQPALLPLDISETDKAYHVKADLPGVDKSGVQVEVSPDGQYLTLSGSRFDETREGEGGEGKERGDEASAAKPLRLERRWSSWSRSLALSADVDVDGVSASLKDGVLEVRLPKVPAAAAPEEEAPAPKRIAVE
jgi:HSP20 family protein